MGSGTWESRKFETSAGSTQTIAVAHATPIRLEPVVPREKNSETSGALTSHEPMIAHVIGLCMVVRMLLFTSVHMWMVPNWKMSHEVMETDPSPASTSERNAAKSAEKKCLSWP